MLPCKQLAEIDGETIIERVLRNAQASEVDEVIAVLGYMANDVAKRIKSPKIKIVVNHEYENGLSSSLKAGLQAIDSKASAGLFLLGDQPFVDSSVINKVVSEYARSHARIVVPTFKGQRGNPVLFDKSLFDEIMALSGDVGGRKIATEHDPEVLTVEVDDPGVLIDIDTRNDLRLAADRISELKAHPRS
jgi:molybdenum cofactor cytidylyltransferase